MSLQHPAIEPGALMILHCDKRDWLRSLEAAAMASLQDIGQIVETAQYHGNPVRLRELSTSSRERVVQGI
jgi:hypothetical protein